MRSKISILVCLLLASTFTYAATKEKAVKTIIRSWQLPSVTGLADTVTVDSTMLNAPLRDMLYDYSINNMYNANTVSPAQSAIYFKRTKYVDDIFSRQYDPYTITPQHVRFYNTTTPYSKVGFSEGFTTDHQETEINFLFTGNLSKSINLGTQMDYLKTPGHYANQEGKMYRGSLWGSYNSTNYSLQASFCWTTLTNFENGGIQNIEDLTGSLNSWDYPTNLHGQSHYRYLAGYLNHYYTVSAPHHRVDSIDTVNEWGEKVKRDTTITTYVPLMTFRHIFETNSSVRQYLEKSGITSRDAYLHQNAWLNNKATNDSSDVLTIRNTLSATFEEEFNRILHFGFSVYAINESQRFLYGTELAPDSLQMGSGSNLSSTAIISTFTDTAFATQWTNNTFVGGRIHKKSGKYVHFDIGGDVCLLGYKLGQFSVDGNVDVNFRIGKDTMHVAANAYINNEVPSFYLQHYRSNHYIWHNDFARVYKYGVGGEISYPTKYVMPKLGVQFEDVQRYVYFDRSGTPQQHDGHIQVISGDLELNIRTPWICLDNSVVVQYSSSDYLPLPLLNLYHNLYYHGWWAKRAMEAQIGADVRYFTSYYAPVLVPALGQFAVQTNEDRVKIGNYPVIDVYANFYVKLIHLKFFVAYTHLNRLFMTSNTNGQTMPNYPINPDVLRAGLSFHFYK